ncbi:hypothetical protein EDM02_05025 [Candidatus Cardinium hertigii]|uniref:Uncharacterized protein n=1 Tax=Candidatus Cardinium hertigii TaxID=247481 RepID=A0A3N2QB00_9BACT|nr:hypothetical protein EDM02_05025 [Candidatus Cardinium hertigii]
MFSNFYTANPYFCGNVDFISFLCIHEFRYVVQHSMQYHYTPFETVAIEKKKKFLIKETSVYLAITKKSLRVDKKQYFSTLNVQKYIDYI